MVARMRLVVLYFVSFYSVFRLSTELVCACVGFLSRGGAGTSVVSYSVKKVP